MRIVPVDLINDSDVLGKSIYSTDSTLLLSAGVKLSDGLTKTLRKNNVYYVYVEDEFSEGIAPMPIIPDEMKIEAVTKMEKVMRRSFSKLTNSKEKYVDLQSHKQFVSVVNDLFSLLSSMPDRLYNMVELMGTNMYTYSHSVNVSVLSIVVGLALGMDKDTIHHMSIGALMHDIGKMEVPENILNKPSSLSDEEFALMKDHAELGYELVKSDRTLSGITKQIIYSHHERLDGTGYPRGLRGNEISQYTRIVSICDMFDAMTTNRVYQKKMPVYKVLDIMMAEALDKIDADLLKVFAQNIAIYRPGETVLLEDGRKGIVVDVRKGYATRPIVRIIEDALGQKPYEIDMKYDLSVFIRDVVDR